MREFTMGQINVYYKSNKMATMKLNIDFAQGSFYYFKNRNKLTHAIEVLVRQDYFLRLHSK